MKLTQGVLAVAMMTGGVWAQNPNIINNVQNKMTAVEQKQSADSNAALSGMDTPVSAQTSKPAPGAPAPAVRPAQIPSSKLVAANKAVSSAAAKPTKSTAPKAAAEEDSDANANNKLERVNVVRQADDIQIEINSRDQVSARVSKLHSPERLVVELPATVMATSQSKIPVGSAGVKGVRIGMNGKNPPTTSVVIDLDKAVGYELTPGPSDKFILTLHTQAVAKSAPVAVPARVAPAKVQAAAVKPAVAVTPKAVKVARAVPPAAPKVAKAAVVAPAIAPKVAKAAVVAPMIAAKIAKAPAAAPKPTAVTIAVSKPVAKGTQAATKVAADEDLAPIGGTEEAAKASKPEDKKWAMNGKRDPFFSPVVQQQSGSGCSTGKKCLEIGQINVRGVVKAESGFIAVVTNSLNKAYFLHENDPVFNGYVMRITGDSVVFQETVQDKLGKSVTREVTKKITTPVV